LDYFLLTDFDGSWLLILSLYCMEKSCSDELLNNFLLCSIEMNCELDGEYFGRTVPLRDKKRN